MEHYYSERPVSPMNLRRIKARLRSEEMEFYTGSGVFSHDKIDKGTEILIDYSEIKDGWRILDLGCGYGAVGAAMAKLFPRCRVVMTDVNERAVKLAKMNIDLHRLKNAEAAQGNMFGSVNEKFDTILLNPPQHAGRKLCFDMIEKSKDYLEQHGKLQLIVRKNKGGTVLGEKMKEIFGNLNVLAKKAGYWLCVSEKK